MKSWMLLILLVLGLPAVASPPGLIDQPQTFPWTVGLTPVALEEAGGLEAGHIRLRSSVLWFNTYRQYGLGKDMEQQIDMEGAIGTVSAVWSPVQGWEIRSQVQGWALGGGVMDFMLSGFHGTLGVPNQGRDSAEDNQYRNFILGVVDDRSPASGLTQASLGIRSFSGPWSWSAWTKFPVPQHGGWGWSSQWGGGSSVAWGDHWPWTELQLTLRTGLSAALVAVAPDSTYPGELSPLTGQAGGYFIVEWSSGFRLVNEASYTAVQRSGAGYLNQAAGLLTLGCQWTVAENLTLEAAVTEEFLTWATNEVGFQAGTAWKF